MRALAVIASALARLAMAAKRKSAPMGGNFYLDSSGDFEPLGATLQKIQKREPGIRDEPAAALGGDLTRKLASGTRLLDIIYPYSLTNPN